MIYLIFTGTIVRMGGAQMYVSNKVKYMKSLGWKVKVFSGVEGPILLKDLQEYAGTIIPELDYAPIYYSTRTQKKIMAQILSEIDPADGEEIIIESSTAHISVWGEAVAKKLSAKHFAFLLDESFRFDRGLVDFFRFKYERNELALINSKSLGMLLGGEFSDKQNTDVVLAASCNNVAADITDPRFTDIPYDSFDYRLCSLGRLNKNYIPNAVEGLKHFAESHPDKKIACFFIGDQPDGYKPDMRAEIDRSLGALANVTVYQMGYVFPIPYSFLDHLDAGVASAGSAWVLCCKDIPTVTMDAKDAQPIGILGYTTHNTLFRKDEEIKTLPALLDEILVKDALKDMKYIQYRILPYEVDFEKHMQFIDKMSDDRSYYDVETIKLQSRTNRIKKKLLSVTGIRSYKRLMGVFKSNKA